MFMIYVYDFVYGFDIRPKRHSGMYKDQDVSTTPGYLVRQAEMSWSQDVICVTSICTLFSQHLYLKILWKLLYSIYISDDNT